MKTLIVFLLLVGIIFIVQGYYEDKLKKVKKSKTIIKKIPVNVYEENMNGSEFIDYQFKSLPEKI
tara:strand:+ start:6807 stop:7001 length:195 start_codon:yes stop_codon:yes gene_type:complete